MSRKDNRHKIVPNGQAQGEEGSYNLEPRLWTARRIGHRYAEISVDLRTICATIPSSGGTPTPRHRSLTLEKLVGNVALLEELDKLTSRKDQVREPVTGDEVLAVVKRRLLGAEPDPDAYTTGSPALGPDGKYQVALEKVAMNPPMSEDKVDLENGFLMMPAAVPVPAPTAGPSPTPPGPTPPGPGPVPLGPRPTPTGPKPTVKTIIRISFASFPAIANLADKSNDGKINVVVQGQTAAVYDPNWLRNAVEEPLDEANVEGMKME